MDNTQVSNERFLHGRDEKEAKEYLIQLGVYDRVVSQSPVGEQGFILIIAANTEYKKRNINHE